MEKKVRIGMDKWFVIGKFVILILFTAFVFWGIYNRGMNPFLGWLCLLSAVLFIWENVYWIDCTKNEICVSRLGILKRHISADRISSIQLIAWRRRFQTYLFVVICLDGHRPYDYNHLFFFWQLSPKVIAVPIVDYEWKEHSQKLTKLYGNVELHPSFRDWRKRQNKKSKK